MKGSSQSSFARRLGKEWPRGALFINCSEFSRPKRIEKFSLGSTWIEIGGEFGQGAEICEALIGLSGWRTPSSPNSPGACDWQFAEREQQLSWQFSRMQDKRSTGECFFALSILRVSVVNSADLSRHKGAPNFKSGTFHFLNRMPCEITTACERSPKGGDRILIVLVTAWLGLHSMLNEKEFPISS